MHPAILILTILLSAVLGVLLYFQWLGFTETGGLFFILLSVAILVNRFWKKRKEKERRERIRENNRNKRKRERERERERERYASGGEQQERKEEDLYLEEMRKLRMELYGSEKKTEYTERRMIREEPLHTGRTGRFVQREAPPSRGNTARRLPTRCAWTPGDPGSGGR